jgi:uncharacterized protein YxjI
MSQLATLIASESVVIRQAEETAEIFINVETRNRYLIQALDSRGVLHAAEIGEGAGAVLRRNLFGHKRPFHISLRDRDRQPVLELRRPWAWFFSRLTVHDGDGQPIGSIEQRFSMFARSFTVRDASGAELARLHGPLFRPWTFRVLVRGQEVGRITKEWGGLLREAMTKADTFGVQFGAQMDPQLRTLVLAATFLIDFLYFE